MTSSLKFIDANIFIERWTNPSAKEFVDALCPDEHCTSVLVLAETYHKLHQKGVISAFDYIRTLMGAMKVHDITQNDLFNAMKSGLDMRINDRIHLEVMKRNSVSVIVSFDKDFDKDKTVRREEV
ncbi:type II toxin-antitoxin system VapC family toxin [Candidatus Woesearchaeota archaeon]|nr:type II toxin-antitoxin system VapC family toxin [Candidatus Woesearchaeota archaeon]